MTIATEVENRQKPIYTQTRSSSSDLSSLPAGRTHPGFRNIKMSREDVHLRMKKIWRMERGKRNIKKVYVQQQKVLAGAKRMKKHRTDNNHTEHFLYSRVIMQEQEILHASRNSPE